MCKFVVGVDADGVLTDMDRFNRENGKKFFGREVSNDKGYNIKELFGVSNEMEIMYGLKYLKKYCVEEPPREYAVEMLQKMISDGDELHEITARKFATFNNVFGKHYRNYFENWLKKYNLNFKSIQYCSESDSPRDKLLACHKLDVDVMIEDKPEVALFLAQNNYNILLVDAPYNKDLTHQNITRVYNWKEIYEKIQKLKKEKKDIDYSGFSKLSKEEKINLNAEEKEEYFKKYKNYLKNIQINEEAIKKIEKKFKLYHSLMKLPVKILFKPKFVGKENVPYQKGMIFASNHLNNYDQFIISLALGNRHLTGLAASTIEDTMRGKLFKRVGAIFVDRNNPDSRKASEEELEKRVINGHDILIFPEGTRKDKDEIGRSQIQLRFKLGAVSIAQKTGAPIVPISIMYSKNNSYVRIGEPILIDKNSDLEAENKKLEGIILNMTIQNKENSVSRKR